MWHLRQDSFCGQKLISDISFQVASFVASETQEQAKSGKWFAVRAGCVTASNAKQVCRTSLTNPSRSLLRKICYPEDGQFWSPQTAWGKEHEEKAMQGYTSACKDIHVRFQCKKSGLHISLEHPYLAASPDGLVNCTCCGEGVVEIKCPFNGREQSVRNLASLKQSCLSLVSDKVVLKKDHQYYYQVQMQMVACDVKYCDFVVWTLKDFIVLRIYKDTQFCTSMVGRCGLYFKMVLLPELCFRYWSDRQDKETQDLEFEPEEAEEDNTEAQKLTQSDEEVYCLCQKPEAGNMVMCDSETCKVIWFHYKCVNLKRAPKAKKWYCPQCRVHFKKA